MRHEDWNQLNAIVIESVTSLLASSGVETAYAGCAEDRVEGWADTISIIGFGGDKLRGSLVLSAPQSLLVRTHPARGTSEEDLADWLSELANLLLGQIKARLSGLGVSFVMSTPITLSATTLRFRRFKGLPVMHAFDSDEGTVVVMFEAIGDDNAQLAAPAEEPVALDAGEVILF